MFSSPSSNAIGFGITFSQAGNLYTFGIHQASVPLNPGSNAILASQQGWHTFDFQNLSSALVNDGGFDLSVTGGEILFGFYTSNGTAFGATSSTGGVDNFHVAIGHAAVPLPAWARLLATGLLPLLRLRRA